MNNVTPFHRHGQPGYYALADLPQRESVYKSSFGVGWPDAMDKLLRLYPGQFVITTGIAGSGKSTFWLNVVANIAADYNHASFLYVPENEGHVIEKLQRIWGVRRGWDAFRREFCFVQSAQPEHYDDAPKTLDWVLLHAATAIEKDGVRLVLIDPWNELERARPKDLTMTDYIGQCLMFLTKFARHYGVTVSLIAHPTKEGIKDGKVPKLSDIEGCYSDDTEVLTRRGWLHHGQVTLSDDVACFDPSTSRVIYHQPSHVHKAEFDGELYRFRGYGYDLAVTPQHRMLLKPAWDEPVGLGNGRGRPVEYPKGQWNFCIAEGMPTSRFVLPLAGEPIDGGARPQHVCIGGKTYPAEQFWKLVGWFVAEGYVGPNGLTWAQAEGDTAEAFTTTFAEAGIPAKVGWSAPRGKGTLTIGRWYIGNRFCRNLVSWFADNCGRGAANKKVPEAVFELASSLKWAFLKAYLEGDGSKIDGTATTVSRRLRDDIQRLAVELGIHTSYGTRAGFGNHQTIYWIRLGRLGRREVAVRTYRNLSRIPYRGFVWCLTVPTGAYFVRRNGRVAACGNSMNWANKCDNGLIVHREINSTHVISAKVREKGGGWRGVCIFAVDEESEQFTPTHVDC